MSEEAKPPWEGYTVYKVFHLKEGRWYAQLVSPLHRTTIAWAKYVMEVHIGYKLDETEQVDHIDDDKSNDDLSNLQILSGVDNTRKSARPLIIVEAKCSICGKSFKRDLLRTRIGSLRAYMSEGSTCSRRCGGIKSRRTKQETENILRSIKPPS